MSEQKLTKEDALLLLKNKYAALQAEGEARYPKRSDFTDSRVVAIKAFLGPWPRALEAAGIKPEKISSDEPTLTSSIPKKTRIKK